MNIIFTLLQVFLLLALAPLVSGFITKIKNNLRMRQGASILQPYYNLNKLFAKGEVISLNASWVFRCAPFIVFGALFAALFFVPGFVSVEQSGDFLVLIFLFGLGRFFLSLAGLDTASAFGGMGSSREMFISGLAEPVIFLAIFALSLQYGSTNLLVLNNLHPFSIAGLTASGALLMVILAETSRLPVDNQETHLELTMIHEAMILEYSGRRLGLIELSAYLKQLIWFILLANIIFPVSIPSGSDVWQLLFWAAVFIGRVFVLGVLIAFFEVSIAKMRLLRVTDFFTFAIALAFIAVGCAMFKL